MRWGGANVRLQPTFGSQGCSYSWGCGLPREGGGDERDERGGPVRGDAGNSDASIERRERASSESGTNVSEDGEAGAAEQVGTCTVQGTCAMLSAEQRGRCASRADAYAGGAPRITRRPALGCGRWRVLGAEADGTTEWT
jgi:hypothetical protein